MKSKSLKKQRGAAFAPNLLGKHPLPSMKCAPQFFEEINFSQLNIGVLVWSYNYTLGILSTITDIQKMHVQTYTKLLKITRI